MKKLLSILVILSLLSSVALAVPYPYRDYELQTTGNLKKIYEDTEKLYTVHVQSETKSVYPWSRYSRARFNAPEVIESEINHRAHLEFWTTEEKEKELKLMHELYVENKINIDVILEADQDVSGGYSYVELEGSLSYITKIILETDKGEIIEPTYIFSGDSDLIGGAWWNYNSVYFPRSIDGKQIIDESTEWIKLWIITSMHRIYFEFEFD